MKYAASLGPDYEVRLKVVNISDGLPPVVVRIYYEVVRKKKPK